MSVCRDCIHFDACARFWYSDYDCVPSVEDSKHKHGNEEACKCFVPTADVVEVVRCKDCTHLNPMGSGGYRKCLRDNLWKDTEDFCSRGERREE